MDLKKLAEEINDCYDEPFLPKGLVEARVTDYGTLWLNIGDRDGEFDENGKRVGSGSVVGSAKRWDLKPLGGE